MHARIPSSIYRLQLHHGFPFASAAELIPYLHEMGVSDCHISPLAQARPGSPHGYDVTDHSIVNSDIGGEDGFREFAREARQLGLGIVVDTVPNHMCIGDSSNRWWFDVLENGPSSPYAFYFDIDWVPPKANLVDKVLLPVLSDQYGRVLENKEIEVFYKDGSFGLSYNAMVFPLAPSTWTVILLSVLEAVERNTGESSRDAMELASIITALNHLPLRSEIDSAKIRERQREKEIIKTRLAALIEASGAVRSAANAAVTAINGVKGVPHSFDRLEKLLADQAYRLSFWHVAADEINYRRFFDVNDLAALRIEQPDVFKPVHELTFRLIREGLVTGLRIDHVDGLRDPGQYLRFLQSECADAAAQSAANLHSRIEGTGANGSSAQSLPFYVVVEKILGADEPLHSEWPVYGTTGYEFLNDLNGLYIDAASRARFYDLYARYTGEVPEFADIVYECKKLVLRASMSGEQNVLARQLDRISEQHRWSRDFTLNSLGRVLAEVIACFPVYRSYVTSEGTVSAEDRSRITTAINSAKRRNAALSESTFDFLASVLLLDHPEGLDDAARAERLNFTLRCQQLTSPVMAKGLEDTALYRFYPLASLNEVGGDPSVFGISAGRFHTRNRRRQREWPHGLSATSTHDTKRSEDVRARINVLTEVPEAWERAVWRWSQLNAAARVELDDGPVPDANEEYLLYQILIGTWPLSKMTPSGHENFIKRMQDYLHKATREAKLRTSWISPHHRHDEALAEFVRKVLEPNENNTFLADFVNFHEPLAMAGMLNSLSQTLVKIGSPGIPDFYQGNELWDDSLVDPDNRRPIDFELRRVMLEQIVRDAARDPLALAERLTANPRDGRIKMYITRCALQFRRENPELFATGAYEPVGAVGERARNVISFVRVNGDAHAIIVAGRFFMSLDAALNLFPKSKAWADTVLTLPHEFASGRYNDIFTGRTFDSHLNGRTRWLPISEVFAQMPIALLVPST